MSLRYTGRQNIEDCGRTKDLKNSQEFRMSVKDKVLCISLTKSLWFEFRPQVLLTNIRSKMVYSHVTPTSPEVSKFRDRT